MRLYEIANEYQRILYEIDICEDDNQKDNLQRELDHLDPQGEEKIINIAGHIRNIEEEAESVRRAVKEMETRARRLEKDSEKWKAYISENAEKLAIKFPLQCPYYKITTRKNAPSLEIMDREKLLFGYSKVKEEIILDNAAIKSDLLSGK